MRWPGRSPSHLGLVHRGSIGVTGTPAFVIHDVPVIRAQHTEVPRRRQARAGRGAARPERRQDQQAAVCHGSRCGLNVQLLVERVGQEVEDSAIVPGVVVPLGRPIQEVGDNVMDPTFGLA